MSGDVVIEVRGVQFRYGPTEPPVLQGLSLEVRRGWRCLLVGRNGAGKTTLLRLLGGKHMVDECAVRVLGCSAFHDISLSRRVCFLGGAFPFTGDIPVSAILDATPGAGPERRARLMRVLQIDPGWRMYRVSDGQRRRVQILLGLLAPAEVILLDEITTDLDVVARADLLAFLREETEQRGATIVYATHILDGLFDWATHLCWVDDGRVRLMDTLANIADVQALHQARVAAPLLRAVEKWLR